MAILETHVFDSPPSPINSRPEKEHSVGVGYKLIGGGGMVNFTVAVGTPGMLLYHSFPIEKNKWRVAAKDHYVPFHSSVTAYATGIYDPSDIWDVQIFNSTLSNLSNNPTAIAEVPPDYTMVGGGGKIEYTSPGVLLTASFPYSKSKWKVTGKDNRDPSQSRATAFAVGIKPKPGINPYKLENRIFFQTYDRSHHHDRIIEVDQSYLCSGGGASCHNDGGPGLFLYKMYPGTDKKSFIAGAKDHNEIDHEVFTIYAIGIRLLNP